jgi:hypothetical protein
MPIGIVAATINGINLLAGLPTTKEIWCALEAEWLHNKYDKCNTQILQRQASLLTSALVGKKYLWELHRWQVVLSIVHHV